MSQNYIIINLGCAKNYRYSVYSVAKMSSYVFDLIYILTILFQVYKPNLFYKQKYLNYTVFTKT